MAKVDFLTSMRDYRSDMNKIMSKYMDTSKQITSGQRYNFYSEMTDDGKTNFKLTNDDAINFSKNFQLSNSLVYKDMQAMYEQLERLYDINEEMGKQIIARQTPIGKLRNLESITKSSLSSIKSVLESRFAGKSLFFGGNNETSKIGDIVNNSNIVDGKITANYAQGDGYKRSIKFFEGEAMEYGVLDHDPAFQNMIAYHHKILDFEQNGDDRKLAEAFELYSTTREQLSDMISKLGAQMREIEAVNERFSKEENFLQETLEKELKPNTAELVAELNEFQYLLEASYKTFSMLKNTNLANYL